MGANELSLSEIGTSRDVSVARDERLTKRDMSDNHSRLIYIRLNGTEFSAKPCKTRETQDFVGIDIQSLRLESYRERSREKSASS